MLKYLDVKLADWCLLPLPNKIIHVRVVSDCVFFLKCVLAVKMSDHHFWLTQSLSVSLHCCCLPSGSPLFLLWHTFQQRQCFSRLCRVNKNKKMWRCVGIRFGVSKCAYVKSIVSVYLKNAFLLILFFCLCNEQPLGWVTGGPGAADCFWDESTTLTAIESHGTVDNTASHV